MNFYRGLAGEAIARRTPDGSDRDRLFWELELLMRRQRERIRGHHARRRGPRGTAPAEQPGVRVFPVVEET